MSTATATTAAGSAAAHAFAASAAARPRIVSATTAESSALRTGTRSRRSAAVTDLIFGRTPSRARRWFCTGAAGLRTRTASTRLRTGTAATRTISSSATRSCPSLATSRTVSGSCPAWAITSATAGTVCGPSSAAGTITNGRASTTCTRSRSATSPCAILSATRATVLSGRLPVSIGCISPVLRIVLPRVALASLPAVNVPVDVLVVVPIEIIVVIDVHVAVVPIAIAPVATPSTPGGGTQCNSRAPCQRRSWDVAWIGIRVIRILSRSSSINDRRIVRWDISYVRIGLLNLDHLLTAAARTAPHCLGLYDLLRTGFEIPCALGFCAHPLNRVHNIRLLRQECVSQVRRPLNIVRHARNHVRKSYQPLDAWVPRLLCHRVRQRLAL